MKSISEIEQTTGYLLNVLDAYRAEKTDRLLPMVNIAARLFEAATHRTPRFSAVDCETDSRACGGMDGERCGGAFLMPDGSLRYWQAGKEISWRGEPGFFGGCEGVQLISREDTGTGWDRVTVKCPGALFPVAP